MSAVPSMPEIETENVRAALERDGASSTNILEIGYLRRDEIWRVSMFHLWEGFDYGRVSRYCCVRFLSLLSTHFISEMAIPLNWCMQSMHELFEATAKMAKILVGHRFFHVQRSVLNSRNYTKANMGSKIPYVQVTEII